MELERRSEKEIGIWKREKQKKKKKRVKKGKTLFSSFFFKIN